MSETSSVSDALERVGHERAYLGVLVAGLVALVGGSLAFPRRVYGEFVWQYFWGPVYADANGAECAAWDGGARRLLYDSTACANAAEPVAYPGYTLVSEVGYAVTLIFALVGLVLLLRRWGIGERRSAFFGLLPFMFLGGVLRVVEDAADAAVLRGFDPAIAYPWNSLIISPVIYFVMFFLTLGTLATAVWLERRGYVDRYERLVGAAGAVFLSVTLAYLLVLAFTTEYVYLLAQFAVVTLGVATAVTWIVWRGVEAFAPELNAGTGRIGAVVLWGHAVDGTANVVGLDWGEELGYPGGDLIPKHPVNEAVVNITDATLPASITDVVGVAWPFLLLKIAVVLFVLAIFDDPVFEDSPRYAILMLVAILAVGLGPGTRDMIRATFGV
jgi:uncharacterized membrane protein